MKYFLFITILFPILGKSQNRSNEISFERSWARAVSRAKSENKPLFIDCFTTWCAPCKKMDADVYVDEKVANYYNSHYVCLKVQMDRTPGDDSITKSAYEIASMIHRDYGIVAFPSFIILSANGVPLHKAVGYKNSEAIIQLGNEAMDPEMQYYTKLRNFKPGVLDTAELRSLAFTYAKQRADELTEKIILDYESRLSDRERFSENNFLFLESFVRLPGIRQLGSSYLCNVDLNGFMGKANMRLAAAIVKAGKGSEMEDCLVKYFLKIHPDRFRDSTNLAFVAQINRLPAMASIVEKYLASLSSAEFKMEKNISLCESYMKSDAIRIVANRRIAEFTSRDLKKFYLSAFVYNATTSTKDAGFNLLHSFPSLIDSVVGTKRTAINKTSLIICSELKKELELFQHKVVASSPDWAGIAKALKAKYSDNICYNVLLILKMDWYQAVGDWNSHIHYLIEKTTLDGIDTVSTYPTPGYFINSVCWNIIFKHSTDTCQLQTAASWMEAALRMSEYTSTALLDTYANLLYKMGKKSQAIFWEAKAIALDPKSNIFKVTLEKMKRDESTWTDNTQ